jgi:uncharacterized membrane protein YedE/YeeE
MPYDTWLRALAGGLVGLGTALANGCTGGTASGARILSASPIVIGI